MGDDNSIYISAQLLASLDRTGFESFKKRFVLNVRPNALPERLNEHWPEHYSRVVPNPRCHATICPR